VKSKRGANVSGSIYPLHDPGMLQFLSTVSKGNEPQLLVQLMLDTIDKAVREGVTKDEVERSKRRLLKQWELASTDSRRIAIQLSEWAAQGDWRLYFLYRDRLEKVGEGDVNRVAKKYLTRTNRTVGMFIPTKAPAETEIPQTPSIAKIVGNYKGRKAATAGEAFSVTPKNIEARTRRITLANGAKAALLPRKTRGETVSMRMSLRFGTAENLKGLDTASDFLGNLMLRGTKSYTRQQLQDELDKHQIRMSVSSSAGSVTVSLRTKRKSMPQALKLLREVLRNPTLPEAEFEILRRAQLASTQQQLTNPQMLAVTKVRRQLARGYDKDDPRYIPTIPENVERLKAAKLGDVQKLYRDYLGGQHALITVIGDFDEKTVVSSLEETLSGWEAKRPYKHIARHADSGKKGIRADINTPGKANAMYFAAMTFPVRDDDPEFAPLELANFILGGGSLASRLGVRVRQKEGLSYGVASMFRADALDKRSQFYVYAIANPKNMPKVKLTILEELERIRKDGVTDRELAAAKKGYLQKQQLGRSGDAGLAQELQETLRADRTMAYYTKLERQIAGVTKEQILSALKKYIHPDRLHIVAAGDFGAKTGGGK
jgi:zinc protease